MLRKARDLRSQLGCPHKPHPSRRLRRHHLKASIRACPRINSRVNYRAGFRDNRRHNPKDKPWDRLKHSLRGNLRAKGNLKGKDNPKGKDNLKDKGNFKDKGSSMVNPRGNPRSNLRSNLRSNPRSNLKVKLRDSLKNNNSKDSPRDNPRDSHRFRLRIYCGPVLVYSWVPPMLSQAVRVFSQVQTTLRRPPLRLTRGRRMRNLHLDKSASLRALVPGNLDMAPSRCNLRKGRSPTGINKKENLARASLAF